MSKPPRVSIGMPLYNAERYLSESIESILSQTYTDFELIISDNASTDGTGDICRKYAALDSRVCHSPNHQNIGAGPNYRRVFGLATGQYFKWQAGDDIIEPTFLQKCVAVLDEDPHVVLCHSFTKLIDSGGREIGPYERRLYTDMDSAPERFRQLVWYDHLCVQIFGLFRADAIRNAGGQGCYVHADGVLLAHVALLGKLHEIPEYLFFNRRHDSQSANVLPAHMQAARRRLTRSVGTQPPPDWWDPRMKGKVAFPYFRIGWEYTSAIMRAPLSPVDRVLCLAYMVPWLGKVAPRILTDLLIAADLVLDPLLNWKPAEAATMRKKPTG